MTILDVEKVVAGYGAAEEILKEASITVDAGEIVTIIGPNGAGKSTLLKLVAGLVLVRRGTVQFCGRDVTSLDALGRSATGISFVPQERKVFGTLTVADNLLISAYHDRAEAGSRREAMYERYPVLAEKCKALARTLSGGQRQILAMAMGLGPVDKVDSRISGSVIQDCLLGGSFGSRRPDGRGMADHRGAIAHRAWQEVSTVTR